MRITQVFRYAWDAAMPALPGCMLDGLSGVELIAPCYHLVVDGGAPKHVRQLFRSPDVQTFEKDLDQLLKHRVPVSLQDLEDHVRTGKKLPRRSVFVSFDDGMREMEEVVAPLCSGKGIPVTFFLATGFLDNRGLCFRHKASILLDELSSEESRGGCVVVAEIQRHMSMRGVQIRDVPAFLRGVRYREAHYLDECARIMEIDFGEYLRDKKPYLTEEQVDGLLEKGFSIGGHSVDHPLFSDLDPLGQIDQTCECMHHLAQRFAIGFKAFAFPFVSTGVQHEYYDTIFGEGIVDMAFCIGETPSGYQGRIVERFGVESGDNRSAMAAWREHASSRLKSRLTRSLRKPRGAVD